VLIAHKIALAPNNAQATYFAKAKIARLHARISNVRNDALHKLTTDLTRRFDTIGVEDLNVRGMMSNHHLARSVADMGFFEFRVHRNEMVEGNPVIPGKPFAYEVRTLSPTGHGP
jgi:putative transposase